MRPEVEVVTLTEQSLQLSTELSGRVSAYRKAEVRPQVGGILLQQLFTEGSTVQAGQFLYKIDPATYQAGVQRARAALASAEAVLHSTKLTRDRRKVLLAGHAVSRQSMEDAEAAYLQAQADVEVCRAALRTAEIELRYTDVPAPISGRIGKSGMTQGALVTAHQTEALAVIQQIDPIYVDMTRSSLELMKLRERYRSGVLHKPGQDSAGVRLLLETGEAYPLEGALRFADITVDESTGMVLLRAVFPNPEQILLPGMYVKAIVQEGVEEKALTVPLSAVKISARGVTSVFVLQADNSLEERVIQLGAHVGQNWLVQDGLQAGEKVVIKNIKQLRHGDKVSLKQ